MEKVLKMLKENRDVKYADFQRKLIPNIEPESIIGVRTPVLRKMAKEIMKEPWCDEFLDELPHRYFEENQLHAFIISELKDFEKCVRRVEQFLPFVDNWATSDQMSPKVFRKNKLKLLPYIEKWLEHSNPYGVRFGIGMVMEHFLDDDTREIYFDKTIDLVSKIAAIRSDEYYVKMMVAWFFATALAKKWNYVIRYVEDFELDPWTHNKTIQKACESYRITKEQKEYLKTLK